MDKVSYSFVKDDSNIVFRSKVNSFNLDHVTDKDISSFYTSFSNYSYFDTGLLPVDGTGLLGIRKAGDHTQVIYQYKPGMYYINWGDHENDSHAKKYYLAQPYRIVIIDFIDNNLLGARTFYAVEPATHSGIQLYHVNLPNINCKGYRGNGVGWICLYHNEDWSTLPFNERLNRALERCSGVEVYNDANMSETDGPRFYAENDYPNYISNPNAWQTKSENEGWEWTLNPSEWIPIQVSSRDDQRQHIEDGHYLTLLDAITGNYAAYYSDTYVPKPINSITRPDLTLSPTRISNWFVRAYNDSQTSFSGLDPYSDSSAHRAKLSVTVQPQLFSEDDEENGEDVVYCPVYGNNIAADECDKIADYYNHDTELIDSICEGCMGSDSLVYATNTLCYYNFDVMSDDLIHDTFSNEWYYIPAIKGPWAVCNSCESLWFSMSSDKEIIPIWHDSENKDNQVCSRCIPDIDTGQPYKECNGCGMNIPTVGSAYYDSERIKYNADEDTVTCPSCVHVQSKQTGIQNAEISAPDKIAELLLQEIKKLTDISESQFTFEEDAEEPF